MKKPNKPSSILRGYRSAIKLLLVVTIFFTSTLGMAGDTETKIAKVTAETTLKATAVDAIDKYSKSTYQVGADAASQGAASKALSIYSLGIAIKDFAEADTDKAKLYASLDAALAVATLATMINPAVGIALQIGLMVVKLLESSMAAGHAKEMYEIMKRIQEYRTQYAKDLGAIIKTEQVALNDAFNRMSFAADSMTKAQNDMIQQCNLINGDSGYEDIMACLSLARLVVLHAKQFNESASFVVNFKSQNFDINKIFEATKIKPEDLNKQIDQNQKTMDLTGKVLNDLETFASRSMANTLVQAIEENSLISSREQFYISCMNDVILLQSTSIQRSLLRYKAQSNALGRSDLERNTEEMYRLTDVFEDKQCFEILNKDTEVGLFGTMLKNRETSKNKIISAFTAEASHD